MDDISDGEAFLMCDAENREREDFSAIERARMYSIAFEEVYGGRTADLAHGVGLSQRRVQEILAVGQLPEGVLNAFGDPRVVSIKVGLRLLALLEANRKRTMRRAEKLVVEQRERETNGKPFLSGRDVLKRFLSVEESGPAGAVSVRPVLAKSGHELLRGKFDPVTGWNLVIPMPSVAVSRGRADGRVFSGDSGALARFRVIGWGKVA